MKNLSKFKEWASRNSEAPLVEYLKERRGEVTEVACISTDFIMVRFAQGQRAILNELLDILEKE